MKKLIAKKTISFGKKAIFCKNKVNEIVIDITLSADEFNRPCFSACGEIWNSRHTDIMCGGQCIDDIMDTYYKPIANNGLYVKIRRLWENNHLNDMDASANAEQANAVKEYLKTHRYDYNDVCEYLKDKNLYCVKVDGVECKYGHEWYYRPISENDLKEICELLDVDIGEFSH